MSGFVESPHMGHPDFRVGNKVFAALGYPDNNWVLVNVTRERQVLLVGAEPAIFQPAKTGASAIQMSRQNVSRAWIP